MSFNPSTRNTWHNIPRSTTVSLSDYIRFPAGFSCSESTQRIDLHRIFQHCLERRKGHSPQTLLYYSAWFFFSWSCFLKNRGPPFPPHHWLPRNYRLSGRRAYRYNLTLSSPAPAQHPFQSPFCPGEAIFSASYGSLERSWRSSSAFSSVASWLASGHSVRVPFRSGWGCGDRGGMWWLGLVSWYALDSKNCYESWRHGSWKMYPLVI